MQNKATVAKIYGKIVADDDPDASYLYQEGLGFEDRRAQYEAGGFAFVGVRAVAELHIPAGGNSHIIQTIESPGLWGVEDDSGDDYFEEVLSEEVEQLHDMLASLGLTFSRDEQICFND